MANKTDPSVNAVSGSDPQNLLEYITRQRIYDSRFWKEECFGLSVADVLEKSAVSETSKITCLGGHGQSYFLAYTLKLLQLHPESDLIIETFIEQDEFKYVRALGCLYLRLTGRPIDIYETLEPLYSDRRKLRYYQPSNPIRPWKIVYMDELIHMLLNDTHALGIALPRLPARPILVEGGYLAPPPPGDDSTAGQDEDGIPLLSRPTALLDVLKEFQYDPEQYLKHKALVEKCPAAIDAWEKRLVKHQQGKSGSKTSTATKEKAVANEEEDEERASSLEKMKQKKDEKDSESVDDDEDDGNDKKNRRKRKRRGKNDDDSDEEGEIDEGDGHLKRKSTSKDGQQSDSETDEEEEEPNDKKKQKKKKKEKKKKKDKRNYDNLFKKSSTSGSKKDESKKQHKDQKSDGGGGGSEEFSEDYWNEQRAKLGLKPLQSK